MDIEEMRAHADKLHSPGANIAHECLDEIERLRAELETERMRLVACSVVATADTPDSAVEARKMLPEYKSPSCEDVARRVDECIQLRAELATQTERADYAWKNTRAIDKHRMEELSRARQQERKRCAEACREAARKTGHESRAFLNEAYLGIADFLEALEDE